MFDRHLTQFGRTRRFSISEVQGDGWEVREEEDSRVLMRVRYRDWHRVERAMAVMRAKVSALEDRGWTPLAGAQSPSAPA